MTGIPLVLSKISIYIDNFSTFSSSSFFSLNRQWGLLHMPLLALVSDDLSTDTTNFEGI